MLRMVPGPTPLHQPKPSLLADWAVSRPAAGDASRILLFALPMPEKNVFRLAESRSITHRFL
jgi:hypothetical protein